MFRPRSSRLILPAAVTSLLVAPACFRGSSETASPAPAINGFSPARGLPGDEVVILGTGFEGTARVTFGGTEAPGFRVEGTGRITAIVPEGAATGKITVKSAAGVAESSGTFTVLTPAPSVAGFSPAAAGVGSVVVVTGARLGQVSGITFGGVAAATWTANPEGTSLTVQVPPGAATGDLALASPGNAPVVAGTFTVTVPVPVPVPTASGFSPASGIQGATVTVTGANLDQVTAVSLGGVAASAFQVAADHNSLTFAVPAGAATGPVVLATAGGPLTVPGGSFTVTIPVPVPTAAGFSPASGIQGATVTVTGANLDQVTAVSLGGVAASAFQVAADHASLTFAVPAGAATGPVVLATARGPLTVPGGSFTVTVPVPVPSATGFSPGSGVQGTTVTVNGANLDQVAAVSLGGVDASAIQVAADRASLTFAVPAGAATGPVVLATAAGTLTVPGGDFTVNLPAPSAASFAPAAGIQGTTITVTGTNLDLVTGVSLAGAPVSEFRVAPGHASLTFTVPPGATTGPITLSAAGGPVAVPGGAFTVTLSATLAPASGVPGTEVVLNGAGLSAVTQVAYGGLILDPARFDLLSDNRMRVRIPDDARAGGDLTVTSGAGSVAMAFALLPSRLETFPGALQAGVRTFVNFYTYATTDWPMTSFPNADRSDIYALGIPKAPVFHAYNPDGYTRDTPPVDENRPGHAFTRYTLSLRLPAPFFEALPASVRQRIADQGLDPATVDILCTSQDYQYNGVTGQTGVYLFRPHYWTDPAAPYWGNYIQQHNLQGAILETDPGVTISGNAPGVLFNFGILTHGPEPALAPGLTLVSGDTEPMAGFDVTRSTGLWSFTQEGTRAAVTLHLLFNDADQAVLDGLTPTAATVQDLVRLLDTNLGASRGVQLLKALFRPVVTAVAQTSDGSGGKTVTLTGTCFSGASQILLDGAPLVGVMALSDTTIRFQLPAAGTTGALQAVTPMGASDPVELPAI